MQFIDPANVKPLKVVVDGGNGMAGPMVGPLLDAARRSSSSRLYWEPDGNFPDHEPNPLLEREPPVHHRQGPRDRRRPRHRLGRRRRPLLLHRRHRRRSSTATSSPRSSPSTCSPRRRARRSSTTSARRARSPTPSSAPAAPRTSTASATRSSRRACATRARSSAARSPGHYYFRDFYNADSGTIPALLILEKLSVEGRKLSELVGDYRSKYFISGEINSTVDDAEAKMRGDRGAVRRRRRSTNSTASRSTTTTGTSTCARRTPSRCCA